MGRTRFVIDPTFLRKLARDPSLIPPLKEAADAAAGKARDIGPVDDGDYRDGIKVAVGADEHGVLARVNANDFKSHWIEFGTIDTPAFAPLRRAVLGGFSTNISGGRS